MSKKNLLSFVAAPETHPPTGDRKIPLHGTDMGLFHCPGCQTDVFLSWWYNRDDLLRTECPTCGKRFDTFTVIKHENIPVKTIHPDPAGKPYYLPGVFTGRQRRASRERSRALREHVKAGGQLRFDQESEDDYYQ